MKKLKNISLRTAQILCIFLLALVSVGVYLFSGETRIRALACEGNYYYSAQEIYSIANLKSAGRTWNQPSFQIVSNLKNDPLISDASVSRNGQNITIHVDEEFILGYYVQDDLNYLLTREGDSIVIEDPKIMKNLIHFPLLADLSDEQMQMLCKEFQDYPDYLTREVLEKIAEILPWEESYDSQMVKMVMQDGNVVFSSIPSMHMIANYQAMLTQLQGEDVCLVLDGENQAIDKIACSYMYMSSEERDQYRAELKAQLEAAKKEAEEEARIQREEEEASSEEDLQREESEDEEDQDQAQDQDLEQPSENEEDLFEQPVQETESQLVDVDDWQECQYNWLLYSPSTDVYRNKWGEEQYIYDETTASFIQLS